jgi:hypothetical protein
MKHDENYVLEIYADEERGGHAFLPFYLPEGKSGNFEVKHEVAKKGEKLTVVSMRNAIFMGLKPSVAVLNNDVTIHRLIEHDGEHGGTWMTTMPQELEQVNRQLRRAHGSVLVGGLGLGLAVAVLHRNTSVNKITVIESSADVCALVEPYLPDGKAAVMHDDLYKWLKRVKKAGITYDFAFYDIWAPTGQTIYTEHVLPLRRASIGVVPQSQIECWNEDEIIGQIKMGCLHWTEGREFFEKMRLVGQKMKNPFDMTAEEFAKFGRYNREVFPFAAWCHAKRPTVARAALEACRYAHALKDPELYDEIWKDWEDYGKA